MKKEKDENKERDVAFDLIMNTGASVYLTGKAGTGKTTFMKDLAGELKKNFSILAPTGVAAINAGGSTIHSFFQLPFTPYLPGITFNGGNDPVRKMGRDKRDLIKKLDLLIIDEVSMVRSDILDSVDEVLRRVRDPRRPFGGLQLLMIGDLYQIPPVVKKEEAGMLSEFYSTPYFFGSKALMELGYVTVELKKVYRQSDPVFLEILNSIREGKITDELLETLNKRYVPNFIIPKKDRYIYLTTHNHKADSVNMGELRKLGGYQYEFEADIVGEFTEKQCPADKVLYLKVGAQVMFIKNDSCKEYYNGMIGVIKEIGKNSITVEAEGKIIEVRKELWTNTKQTLDKVSMCINEEVVGEFRQYPLRLAWAITIHKSQGLTFDKAIIDVQDAFASGQTYVALSRCRSLEGMVLSTTISKNAIITDPVVINFMNQALSYFPTPEEIGGMKRKYYMDGLAWFFDFSDLSRLYFDHYTYLSRSNQEGRKYAERLREKELRAVQSLYDFGNKFLYECSKIVEGKIEGYESDYYLQDRIKTASAYFRKNLEPLFDSLVAWKGLGFTGDAKEIVGDRIRKIEDIIKVRYTLLGFVKDNGFEISEFNYRRSEAEIKVDEIVLTEEGKLKKQVKDELENWRREKASSKGVLPSTVLRNQSLLEIIDFLPTTIEELHEVRGVGEKTIKNYGKEIIKIIEAHITKV